MERFDKGFAKSKYDVSNEKDSERFSDNKIVLALEILISQLEIRIGLFTILR